MEVDKTYKVTLGGAQTCSVANIQVQLCVLWCDFLCKHRLYGLFLVRLASSVEVSEHKFKGIDFKSHVSLALYLEYILYMIKYDIYIYSKYMSYNAPPYATLPHPQQ